MSFKFFTILLFIPIYSFSQNNYVFQHLTVEDGLLSNPRVNTFQDGEGFYWFNAANGIQRFDGKNFITYLYPENETRANTDEWTGKPLEDNEKNIWIINGNGINIYQRNHQKIIRLYMSDAHDSNTNNVNSLIKDEQNRIWIITSKNIFQYNYKSEKPVFICKIFDDGASDIITATYERDKFWLLISPSEGSYKIAWFDYHKIQINYLENIDVTKLFISYKPIAFFKADESNNLWMADYWGNLFKYNTIKNQLFQYSVLNKKDKEKKTLTYSVIHDFIDDNNGTIWFGGENIGLLKYNINADSFTIVKYENGSEYGLHYDQKIHGFFKDREGNIWINTDLGMNIFNPKLQQFKYLSQKAELPLQFTANVTSIFESSKKDIFIGTWGNGIFKYDSNFILRNHYVYDKNNPSLFGEPLNRAWCISEDDKGNIWIGAQYGMLSILAPATGKFVNRIVPEFEHFTIMHIIKDKENNLWFGLYNGMLAEWNTATQKLAVYKNLYGNSFKESTIVDGLLSDNKNSIWVATSLYGLNRFSHATKRMDEQVFFSPHVFSPYLLNDSVIIGGTLNKGFFMFNKLTKEIKYFNTTNGLSTNLVYGGMPDGSNNIWIFTSNGIERLNLNNAKIFHYNLNDGIKDHIFLKAFCKLRNGVFMVAANSGIIYFNPDSINVKLPPPNVIITNFSVEQQSLSVDSLLQKKTINLSHHQNVIEIGFASVSFSGRKTEKYFYQLNGVDRNWVSAGNQRSVTYANLTPGDYIFKVKSQNSEGIETPQTTTLNFVIHPPWWQTWWAYLLWVILISTLVYTVYDYRKRSRNELSNIRHRIATDLHDDIGSTLNSISVYSEIANREFQSNAENAKIILDKMGTASRNMIDTMNDIVWTVNPKNDYFENILQRMQYFAGELLSAKNILLQFNVDENVKHIKLPMGKRKHFYLIFKEAINNAYKYADSKTVNVSIEKQTQNMVMIITDDGAGFEVEKKVTMGNGLKNMQARAKEINAQLSITSGLKEGTRIELRVPV